MNRRTVRAQPKRTREELRATLSAIPWNGDVAPVAVRPGRALTRSQGKAKGCAETGVSCGECGSTDDLLVKDNGWARCGSCRTAWAKERGSQKVEPEHVRALVAGGADLPTCRTCGGKLELEGKRPPLLFVTDAGEISGGYCRGCTNAWREQKAQAALHEDVLRRVGPAGRSKGRMTQEMLKEGRRLADVRLAFQMLIEEGSLVQTGGIVKKP